MRLPKSGTRHRAVRGESNPRQVMISRSNLFNVKELDGDLKSPGHGRGLPNRNRGELVLPI